MRKLLLFVAIAASLLIGCKDADVASANLSEDADMFRIYRRVIFYNGITDQYILQIEGYCSIDDYNGQLEVVVKLDNGTYMKHFLGLSDNVTYFVEQIDPVKVSDSRYKVIFKPISIVPEIELTN
jgi:predicted nucleic acid-binding Zn finger protein